MSNPNISRIDHKSSSFDHNETHPNSRYLTVRSPIQNKYPLTTRTLSDCGPDSPKNVPKPNRSTSDLQSESTNIKFRIPSIIMPDMSDSRDTDIKPTSVKHSQQQQQQQLQQQRQQQQQEILFHMNQSASDLTNKYERLAENKPIESATRTSRRPPNRTLLRRQNRTAEPNSSIDAIPNSHSAVDTFKRWINSPSQQQQQQQQQQPQLCTPESNTSVVTIHCPSKSGQIDFAVDNQLKKPTPASPHAVKRGFLRHPLRKAMSYVKTQSESTTGMQNYANNQSSVATDRGLIQKTTPRLALYSKSNKSLHPSSSSTKATKHIMGDTHFSKSADLLFGEQESIKTANKSETERKNKPKDIHHLSVLFASIIPRPLSTAFRRPVGKCKSASPSTSPDRTTQSSPHSFQLNTPGRISESTGLTNRINSNSAFPSSDETFITRSLPTKQQLLLWEQSFDELLADPDGLAQLYAFLKSEYSEENIEFWAVCELYKHLPPSDLGEQSQKIYRLYLAPQSPREVNLDAETRKQTISALANPEMNIFDAAQQTIQGLMKKDSYQRFLRSQAYMDLRHLVWHTDQSSDEPPDKDKRTGSILHCKSLDNSHMPGGEVRSSNTKSGRPLFSANSLDEDDFEHEYPPVVSPGSTIPSPQHSFNLDDTMESDLQTETDELFISPASESRWAVYSHCTEDIHPETPSSVHLQPNPCSPELSNFTQTDCKLKPNIQADI